MNDRDFENFVQKAREQLEGGGEPLSSSEVGLAMLTFVNELQKLVDDPRVEALRPVLAGMAVVLAGQLVLAAGLEARVQQLEERERGARLS